MHLQKPLGIASRSLMYREKTLSNFATSEAVVDFFLSVDFFFRR